MTERLKTILKGAIKEEEHFIKFYKDASERTDLPSVKELFKKLSEQEQEHKEKLKALDIDKLQSTILPAIDQISTEENLLLTPLDEFPSLKEAFGFAISAEQATYEMYNNLADSITDRSAKDLFTLLAEEEKKHEKVLKLEVQKLGL